MARAFAVVLFPLAIACTGDRGASRGVDITRDSAGIALLAMDGVVMCEECRLTVELDARIGDREGRGLAEAEWAALDYDDSTGLYGVVWANDESAEVDLYDRTGRYIRSIGRRGQGPGEFARAPYQFDLRDGTLTVMNYPGDDWIVYRDDGTLVDSWRNPEPRAYEFVQLSPDTALLVVLGRRNEDLPRPLVSISSRRTVGAMPGSVFTHDDPNSPFATPLIAAGSAPGTVAVGWRDQLLIREWSTDGELLRVLRGEPQGFPVLNAPREADDPPPNLLASIAFDRRGRLWTLTNVPADTWAEHRDGLREFIGGRTGPVGVPVTLINSLPRSTAPRLDVFDLERGLHLGSWVSDARRVGLVERDGELAAYTVELDDALEPSLRVYRVEFP